MSAVADAVTRAGTERGVERSRIVQSARLAIAPYELADAWQRSRARAVAEGSAPEIVLLLEHAPVYTQGRRGGRAHVLDTLRAPIVDTDRGGDLTFHGPGQLVIWPILRLRERGIGIAQYIRWLEETAIRTAQRFGVEAERVKGRPGVWLNNRKLASVGVRVQSGVSRHGMALNCDVDLAWFDSIRACGIADAQATSLSVETGRNVDTAECIGVLERCFAEVFELRLSPVLDLEISR
jgi:lipoyl(octanoyl) transferase